jgi:ABC-type methionine transport system ATPase subunit
MELMPTKPRRSKSLTKEGSESSSKTKRVSMRLELDFPAKMVTEPLIYNLVKKFDLIPNIRRANVTQKFGYIQLELHGRQVALERGIAWLIKQGVRVEPIVKDVLES